jgi:hypothetical protein
VRETVVLPLEDNPLPSITKTSLSKQTVPPAPEHPDREVIEAASIKLALANRSDKKHRSFIPLTQEGHKR